MGGGTSGTVFRVWDEDLSRPVALKLLHERYVDPKASLRPEDQRRARARFIDEARLTAQLDHPNIVPLHDFGVTGNGRPYFTMKFVKGRTLAEIIDLHHSENGHWTLVRTLGVFLKACEAVDYAHEKGVIHRDLKPSNIMVAASARCTSLTGDSSVDSKWTTRASRTRERCKWTSVRSRTSSANRWTRR